MNAAMKALAEQTVCAMATAWTFIRNKLVDVDEVDDIDEANIIM
jgi:hypothetical protein